MADAQKAMEYFYAHLFVRSPEIRVMFPLGMIDLRGRVFGALARLVWSLDSPPEAAAYLGRLSRDHRRFGVRDKHHRAFFDALLTTVQHFSGPAWTPAVSEAWTAALTGAAAVMRSAATADAARQPPWWLGEVVRHERRTAEVAVLTIRPSQPLRFVPGQYLSVQVPRWPRIWRSFSIASAPRPDGLLDLHVKAVPGGMVSTALVQHAAVGDTLLLGRARGGMILPSGAARRDLLCVAGGTGLAPLKAIIESVAAGPGGSEGSGGLGPGRPPRITLFFGARRPDDLYDLPGLEALASRYPALTVIPVVSHDPAFAGLRGLLPEIVARHAVPADCDAFISGPDAMVAQTARLLAGQLPANRIHHDPLAAAPVVDPPVVSSPVVSFTA